MSTTDKVLTLLLDVDDTLLDFYSAEQCSVEYIQRIVNKGDYGDFVKDFCRINNNLWLQYEQGLVTQQEIVYKRFEVLFKICGVDNFNPHEIGIEYKEYLAQQNKVIQGSQQLLENLVAKHRLFLITNGCAQTQRSRLKLANITEYFEDIFISEEIGARKPQVEFMNYVSQHIKGFDFDKTYIIGDSLTSDILLGKNSGVSTIWFNRFDIRNETAIKPTYEVNNYTSLQKLIDSLAKDKSTKR